MSKELRDKDGWSDSYAGRSTSPIHYYKEGISLCGMRKLDNSSFGFDKSKRTMNDSYSSHCKSCIKKHLNK